MAETQILRRQKMSLEYQLSHEVTVGRIGSVSETWTDVWRREGRTADVAVGSEVLYVPYGIYSIKTSSPPLPVFP